MESNELRLRLTNIENKLDNIEISLKYVISQIEAEMDEYDNDEEDDEDNDKNKLNKDDDFGGQDAISKEKIKLKRQEF